MHHHQQQELPPPKPPPLHWAGVQSLLPIALAAEPAAVVVAHGYMRLRAPLLLAMRMPAATNTSWIECVL
jgi:hypothetical protein